MRGSPSTRAANRSTTSASARRLRHLCNRELLIAEADVQRVRSDGFHLSRAACTRTRTTKRSDTTRRRRCSCWPRPAGRIAMRPDASSKNGQPLAIEIALRGSRLRALCLPIYQEDLRKVGITLNLRLRHVRNAVQAARRTNLRHGVDRVYRRRCFRAPEAELVGPAWPTRRTPTTSPASRTSALTRSSTSTTRSSTSSKRVTAPAASSTASLPNEHHWILEWEAPYQRVRLLEQVRPAARASHAHRRLPRHPVACGGSIPEGDRSWSEAMRELRRSSSVKAPSRTSTGSSTPSVEARAKQSRERDDRLLSSDGCC